MNLSAGVSREWAEQRYACEFHTAPFWLRDDLVFLGEIPETSLGEQMLTGSVIIGRRVVKDLLLDDSALVWKSGKGLVIFVGCGHSGIINIIEYAKRVAGEKRVQAVIGGFHLRSAPKETIKRVAEYLQAQEIPVIHPCHCTGHAANFLPNQVTIQTGSALEI